MIIIRPKYSHSAEMQGEEARAIARMIGRGRAAIALVIGGREGWLASIQVICGKERPSVPIRFVGGKERRVVRIAAMGGKRRPANAGVIGNREKRLSCVRDPR
jgi:hypothetical protein